MASAAARRFWPTASAVGKQIFAGLALTLGSIGIYGVLSFLVSKRTREIGVRLALGAQTSDIFRLIMKEGAKLAATGIGCGIGGAFAISRTLSSELHGVSPADPITYVTVALIVAAVTCLPATCPRAEPSASIPSWLCEISEPSARSHPMAARLQLAALCSYARSCASFS